MLLPRLRNVIAAGRDRVTPEDLNVAPELLGMRLAGPWRRLMAITVDVLVVGVLSSLGNAWLLAACAALVLLQLPGEQGDAVRRHKRWVWALAIVLAGVGLQQAWTAGGRVHNRVVSVDGVEVARLDTEDDDDEDRPSPPKPPAPSASETPIDPAVRIAALESALAQARKPKRFDPQAEFSRWLRGLGVGFGWAVVYFSLLPVWWEGQTVGKRLFKLRVVELTGKPMTVLRCLKRYGGYAAGMATGMLGFAQVFWDSNRQAIQDKTAHTVVVDLRGGSPL